MNLPKDKRSTVGLLLFGAAMVFLGVEPVVTGHLPRALVPLSPGAMLPWAARGIGFLLIATAMAALLKPASLAPYLLAAFPLLAVLTVNGPKLLASPRDPSPWTTTFELIALAAGAVLLVKPRIGRLMLAASLPVFGIQHLMYGTFVATLVPDWIPARLFWAYAVGVAFLAASLSLLLNKATRLTGTLLGIMFMSWVLVLHIPRVIAASGNALEWNSCLIALAMSGVGLIVAGEGDRIPDIRKADGRLPRLQRDEIHP